MPACNADNRPSQTDRRRKYSFGLRTFLLAIAVISVILGPISRESNRLRNQRALAAQIFASGGSVGYDRPSAAPWWNFAWSTATEPMRRALGLDLFKEITSVKWDYTFSTVGGENIVLVKQLPQLRSLALVGTARTNGRPPAPGQSPAEKLNPKADLEKQAVAFGAIVECRQLTSLTLMGGMATDLHLQHLRTGGSLQRFELRHAPAVTDIGLKAIGGFRNLTELILGDVPQITEKGVLVLAESTNLRSLVLTGIPVTNAALAALGRLHRLERLLIDRCEITDEGLTALGGLSNLHSLRISGSPISDHGLASLGRLHELRNLDISNNPITDKGLQHLENLTALRALTLTGTGISDDGLLSLRRMPKLEHVVLLLNDRLTIEGIRRVKSDMPDCLFECLSWNGKNAAPSLHAWE